MRTKRIQNPPSVGSSPTVAIPHEDRQYVLHCETDDLSRSPRRSPRSPRDPLSWTSVLIALATLALIITAAARDAVAHTPNRDACTTAWHAADDGERLAAKRACEARQARHRLMHATAPCRIVPRSVSVKHVRATSHQRRMLTRALNEARRMQAPRSHHVAVVAGMTQESQATNLPYGDGTSVGILQLIDEHGSKRWRMVPENSVGWMLRGMRKLDPRGRAPLATRRGRHGLIQRVQRSGHPYAYNQWIAEARRTVAAHQRGCRR